MPLFLFGGVVAVGGGVLGATRLLAAELAKARRKPRSLDRQVDGRRAQAEAAYEAEPYKSAVEGPRHENEQAEPCHETHQASEEQLDSPVAGRDDDCDRPAAAPQVDLSQGTVAIQALRSSCDDFELWVETDLDNEWCLEDEPSCLLSDNQWRENCQTSRMRRRWNDFEELAQQPQVLTGRRRNRRPEAALAVCLKLLGLPEGADAAQVKAAYHKHCLASHPDKGGDAAEFSSLVTAYHELRNGVLGA